MQLWLGIAQAIATFASLIFGLIFGLKKINDGLNTRFAAQEKRINEEAMASISARGQMEAGLRAKMAEMDSAIWTKVNQVELHIRDFYVADKDFERVISMAAANNENQFRALSEQMARINDKLDNMQRTSSRVAT